MVIMVIMVITDALHPYPLLVIFSLHPPFLLLTFSASSVGLLLFIECVFDMRPVVTYMRKTEGNFWKLVLSYDHGFQEIEIQTSDWHGKCH